jgi:hypothetical protein
MIKPLTAADLDDVPDGKGPGIIIMSIQAAERIWCEDLGQSDEQIKDRWQKIADGKDETARLIEFEGGHLVEFDRK